MAAAPPSQPRVVSVHAFPVKGMAAGDLDRVSVTADGVAGDRRLAVLDDGGRLVGADDAPALRSVAARLADDGTPVLSVPQVGEVSGGAADAALTHLLGRSVHLAAVEPGRTLDAPVHLVSVQSMQAAARGEHEVADCACSLEEPRANLVLDLGAAGDREEQWVGRRVRVGSAVLELHRRPGHCLGVYAQVLEPGDVRPGDPVDRLPDA